MGLQMRWKILKLEWANSRMRRQEVGAAGALPCEMIVQRRDVFAARDVADELRGLRNRSDERFVSGRGKTIPHRFAGLAKRGQSWASYPARAITPPPRQISPS
jgi:hypothetical protein